MADVYGTIGNEYVELNNAATEATLKQLLAAVRAQGGLGAAGKASGVAGAAGVDPAAISAANAGLRQTGTATQASTGALNKFFTSVGEGIGKFSKLDAALTPLVSKLLQGTAQASDAFGALSQLPGLAGYLGSVFQRVAQFQEKNLETYQKITDAGVGFGGSLTQMRQAALNTYMTLDQFTNLMKTQSETFAKLGGTADQGAKSFVKISNEFLKSEAGDRLRALGYTSEQVNSGLANYLAITGGRNKQELQNTAAITKAASEYMTQLDALAVITGKSREEQEKQLKEAQANAAYEAYLQTLDEEGRKKATLAMQNALAVGGKAGADLLKSQLLGLPPMTEAAQKLQALGPNVAAGIQQMGNAVGDMQKTTNDVNQGFAAARVGATTDMEKFGKSAAALSFGSDSTSQALMGMQAQANRNRQQGIETQEQAMKQQAQVSEEQKKRMESEARQAVETQKAMQELGQNLLNTLLPVIQMLTNVMNPLIKVVSSIAEVFNALPGPIQAAIAATIAYALFMRKKSSGPALPDTGGGGGGGGRGGGGGGRGGLGGRLLGGLKGLGIGAVGGMLLGGASDMAAASGKEGLAGALDVGSEAANFAGMGAMLGSVVPGLGTVVGGALGGVAGGAYGLYKNWGRLFGKSNETPAYGGPGTGSNTALPSDLGPGSLAVPAVSGTGAAVAAPGGGGAPATIESLKTELQSLNKQTAEMLRYIKETADYSKRNVEATTSLNGDLFRF